MEHTEEQKRIMDEYNNSSDQDVIDFISDIRSGKDKLNYVTDGLTTTAHPDENGKPSPMISFSKRIDGTYYVIETVNEVKTKRNYVVTAFIKSSKE